MDTWTIHLAALVDRENIVEILLEQGANIRAKNAWSEMPFELAKNDDIRALLYDDSLEKTNLYSAMCQLKYCPGDKGLIKSIKSLIARGANINEMEDTLVGQNTPLHLAILAKCHTTVLILIRKRANIEAKNVYGETPYDFTKDGEIHDLLLNDEYKTQPNTINLTDLSAHIIGTGENECIQQ